jgi:hypothetical protein
MGKFVPHQSEGRPLSRRLSHMKAIIISCIFAFAVIINIRQWAVTAGTIKDEHSQHGQTELAEFAWHQVRIVFMFIFHPHFSIRVKLKNI